MEHPEDMKNFENVAGESDALDDLVRGCLDAEASSVDGAGLLERARRTTRRRRWTRHAGLAAALAASVAIIVLAYRAGGPKPIESEPAPPLPVAVDTPGNAGSSLEGLAAAANISPMLPDAASAMESFGETFTQTRVTLASDARCIREEVGGLVSTSLARAGLFL